MKNIIFLLILNIISLSVAVCQTEDEIKEEVENALKMWIENPTSLDEENLDPNVLDLFHDSGNYVNGLKEGFWIEFSIDSTEINQTNEIKFGDKIISANSTPDLKKEEGLYINGKREGVWKVYKSYDKKPPFGWGISRTITYSKGLKNGEEITYLYLNRPILIMNWKNGIEDGIVKIYDINSPHNLQQVYLAKEGKLWTQETYYNDGKLSTIFTDTIINDIPLKFYREYNENGLLFMTGFYINGIDKHGEWCTFGDNGRLLSLLTFEHGTMTGPYKYYHPNGQLWTERLYKNNNLIKVISNYDINGKKRNPGKLKNGTGTVNIYDREGNLKRIDYYQNGKEVENNR